MLSCGMSCVKHLLFSFNLLFVISGIAVALIAGLVFHNISFYGLFLGGNAFFVCLLLVIIGAIVLVVAFFGCCGALKENRCMLITFSVLLFILFVMEISVGVVVYVTKDGIKDELRNTLFEYEDSTIRESWDMLQTDFQCCGVNGPDDWIAAHLKIPASCCGGHVVKHNCTVLPYQKGCLGSLEEYISHHVVVLGGVGIGIAFVQLFGMILACSLSEAIRKGYRIM